MTTAPIASIHPVERAAHRLGLTLVHWSIARAERRDRALALRRGSTLPRLDATEAVHASERERAVREHAWLRRAAEVARFR